MRRKSKAWQLREGAATGPDAEPCVQAGSPIPDSTPPPSRGRDFTPANDANDTGASFSVEEVLLGVTMWLANERDALDGALALAQTTRDAEAPPPGPATVLLPLADLTRLEHGLGRAFALLDRLAIDPTKISAVRATDPAAPARVLQ